MTLIEMSRRGRRDRKNEGVPRHVLRGRSSLAEPGGSGQKSRRNSESGAVLILALVYIIAISLTVGALARWATDDLDNTNNFSVTGQLHTAMTSAMTTAIESIRYTPWPSGTGTTGEYLLPTKGVATGWGWCFQPTSGTVSSITLTTYTKSVPTVYTIDIYCNTVEHNLEKETRVVTFAACPSTTTAAACEANPLLSAVAEFDDYPSGGSQGLQTQCNVVPVPCGEGQLLKNWIWL